MKYYVFISLVTPLIIDKIVAGLFRLGYSVAPTTPTGYIVSTGDDSPATLLSLEIGAKDTNADHLRIAIQDFLNVSKVSYYSLIVLTGMTIDASWAGSNISLKRIRDAAALRKKDSSHLKLVKNVPHLQIVRTKATPPPLPPQDK